MANDLLPPPTQAEIDALRRRVAELEEELRARASVEQALRTDEERFRALMTSVAQIFWIANAKGELLVDSPSWRRYSGQTMDQMRGLGWMSAVHPDDRAGIDQAWKAAAVDGGVYRTQYRLRRHDGVYREFEAQGAPLRDADGVIREWIGACIDITERNRAERALRLSEERFRLLSLRLPVGVFQSDPTGEITFANDRWCELLDISQKQVASRSWYERIHPDDRQRVRDEVAKSIREVAPLDMEYRVLLREGRLRWIQVVAVPLRGDDAALEGFLGAVTDISEHKQLEGLLRETVVQRDVIEAQRARLAELSTPLIPIAEGIMAVPLVGDVDRERADRVVETLLAGISAAGARVAILDLTGVLEADTDVAEGLVRAAKGLRLLGAQAVLSGVRPELARTLVEMGADLGGMPTFGDPKAAIAYGMRLARRRG